MEKRVLVPIAHGSEDMEAVIIIDMLRRAGINVVVTADQEIITFARFIKIIPDKLIDQLENLEDFDAIIIPGGMEGVHNLIEDANLKKILELNKDKLIGAICAAPILLAENKIIKKGIRLTSHPSVRMQLSEYEYSTDKVVISDNIITSRGAGTAFDFSLKIIEILINKETADKIAKDIVHNV